MHVKKIYKLTRNISKSFKGVKHSINKNLKGGTTKAQRKRIITKYSRVILYKSLSAQLQYPRGVTLQKKKACFFFSFRACSSTRTWVHALSFGSMVISSRTPSSSFTSWPSWQLWKDPVHWGPGRGTNTQLETLPFRMPYILRKQSCFKYAPNSYWPVSCSSISIG